MSKGSKGLDKKKKLIICISAVVLLLLIILLLFLVIRNFMNKEEVSTSPVLTIVSPQRIDPKESDELILDVTVSSFGDASYPAASMSISFDPSRLEFLGVEEGNVLVRSNTGDVTGKLPEWSCNPAQCNKTGKINIMYLDVTGGTNAFSRELLSEDGNVVLRLKFRLRGSVRDGDVYDLIFEDAVFAASDEAQSLAMTTGTLEVRNGKLVIGE